MYLSAISNLFDKIKEIIHAISDFGNLIFEKSIGLIGHMSGMAAGFATLAICFFVVMGILSMLKKSVKILAIVLLGIIAAIVCLSFIK